MRIRKSEGGNVVTYQCPCGDTHSLRVAGPGARWSWNGDEEKPTFSPSVHVTTGHYIPRERSDGSCWCTYKAEHPEENLPFGCYRCHSFVRDGIVEFLGDCSHALAGQSVPIGEWNTHLPKE